VQEYWLAKARQSREETSVTLRALEKAFSAEPRNPETAYWIGELFRFQSWQGEDNYRDLAFRAMEWFRAGMALNRHDSRNPLRLGMCLDWIGQHEEAGAWFGRALELDPNGYYTVAHQGWHRLQVGDWAGAKEQFARSLRLTARPWRPNPVARSYMGIINRREAEAKKTR
jgi:tetratricopeptide (TPR) repeat protein